MARYKLMEVPNDHKTEVLLLRDDGYRIYFKWVEGRPHNVEHDEWILWADYKQCDIPRVCSLIVDLVMVEKPTK